MDKHTNTQYAICPHCNHPFADSWTMADSDGYTCPVCKGRFVVQVELTPTYTTRKASAPKEVLIASINYLNGASMEKIAKALYGDGKKYRQKAWRNVGKWKEEYPKLFDK